MKIFWIIFTFLLIENVLCKNAWEIQNKDVDKIQEMCKKTIIVGYSKAKMTKDEIEKEKIRIEKACKCKVENLANVGAFILTYDTPSHPGIETLRLDPATEIGVEDQIVTVLKDEEIPTDPEFSQQWALQNLDNNADINAGVGWREYMNDSIGGDPNGPSVVVAVIDSGVDYTHEDLKDVMWTNPGEIAGNGLDDDNNAIVDDIHGADFSHGGDNDPIDRFGHGTHCAGIIAAKENNDKGIAGVASFTQGKVKIMAVQGLSDDDGRGAMSSLFRSLNYAIEKGATISSNSWGGPSMTPPDKAVWGNVLKNNPNHLFIAAAGNDHRHLEDDIGNSYQIMTCGLNEPNLLCVGSSTSGNEKSIFSNYGKGFVHVMAPGSNILSTIPNNLIKEDSGTSMACPHVSGLAALVRTMRPNMTAVQVRKVIEANVQKKANYTRMVSTGGLIDMGETIRALKYCEMVDVELTENCYCWDPASEIGAPCTRGQKCDGMGTCRDGRTSPAAASPSMTPGYPSPSPEHPSPSPGSPEWVSCGCHFAPTCAQCGILPSMCNGECKWTNHGCVQKLPGYARDRDDSW